MYELNDLVGIIVACLANERRTVQARLPGPPGPLRDDGRRTKPAVRHGDGRYPRIGRKLPDCGGTS